MAGRPADPRRAGVSAFGISGTNAHVILEEPPPPNRPPPKTRPRPRRGRRCRGCSPPARRRPYRQSARLADHLDRHRAAGRLRPDTRHRRAHHPHRARHPRHPRRAPRRPPSPPEPRPWCAASRARPEDRASAPARDHNGPAWAQPYHAQPVFPDAFDDACAQLDPHLDRPLGEAMVDDPGPRSPPSHPVHPTRPVRPHVALPPLAHWGIPPDYLIGHSIGELSAAHLAGVLTLHDAAPWSPPEAA